MSSTVKKTSLNDTMTRMSKRMDDILDDQSRRKMDDPDDLPLELTAWMAIDPLLADLHKQMIEAKAHRDRLAKLHGADDPMADVAEDMMDSAQSAFETRLLELRRQANTKARVMAMIRKAQDEAEEARIVEARNRSHQFWTEFAIPKGGKPQKARAEDNMWLVMAGFLALQSFLNNTRANMAADFDRASSRDDRSLKSRFAAC